MTKRIGDLTYQEAVNLCEKYLHKCKNCPLGFVVSEEEEWIDCRVDLIISEIKPILDREIEVDKKELAPLDDTSHKFVENLVDDYVNKIIDNYNLRDYTVDYILICDEANIDEAIDYHTFDKPDRDWVAKLVALKKFLEDNEDEIKSKLLKHQRDKYGDVGLGNVRVQGM